MKRRGVVFLIVAACILLLDFLSKRYIVDHIPRMISPVFPYGGLAVFQNLLGVDFCITHAVNTGAAWGVFSDYKLTLIIIRILLIFSLIFYQFKQPLTLLKRISFACVTAGAIGNVIDHFIYGHVIDMFFFTLASYHFPVFNVADTFIFCGISYLLIEGLFVKPKDLSPEKS